MTYDPLDIPTFLLRGHPDHDKAIAEGERILSNSPAPPLVKLPTNQPVRQRKRKPVRQRKRKRRSSTEMETLRSLGFNAEETRSLSIKESERICRQGEPAGTWRTNRAMRELDTIGK